MPLCFAASAFDKTWPYRRELYRDFYCLTNEVQHALFEREGISLRVDEWDRDKSLSLRVLMPLRNSLLILSLTINQVSCTTMASTSDVFFRIARLVLTLLREMRVLRNRLADCTNSGLSMCCLMPLMVWGIIAMGLSRC